MFSSVAEVLPVNEEQPGKHKQTELSGVYPRDAD